MYVHSDLLVRVVAFLDPPREWAVVAQAGKEWAAAVDLASKQVPADVYVKGSVTAAEQRMLDSIACVEAFRVYDCDTALFQQLCVWAASMPLRHIVIQRGSEGTMSVRSLLMETASTLESISLVLPAIRRALPPAFDSMPRLRTLWLQSERLSNVTLERLFPTDSPLQELGLVNLIPRTPSAFLRFTQLRQLDLVLQHGTYTFYLDDLTVCHLAILRTVGVDLRLRSRTLLPQLHSLFILNGSLDDADCIVAPRLLHLLLDHRGSHFDNAGLVSLGATLTRPLHRLLARGTPLSLEALDALVGADTAALLDSCRSIPRDVRHKHAERWRARRPLCSYCIASAGS